TKITGVKYDAAATCPRWLQFLAEIFAGDAELIEFVQRAFGYSLTGDTSEQVFFLLYGIGKNGKTTFLNVVRALLGEYGTAAQMDTFSERGKQANGHNEDLARLRGARFVSAVETEESRRLAEGAIKQITGGDPVAASFKGEHVFTYTPQYKIWLAANHRPVIRGTDEGIWRRVLLIPFLEAFETDPEKAKQPGKRAADKNLEKTLLAELSGILNWTIQGCLKWQAKGLPRPERVKAATNQYREDSDILGQYLAQRTTSENSRAQTNATEFYRDYYLWCEHSGHYPIKQNQFADGLRDREFSKQKVSGGKIAYVGIGLLAKPEGESEK
ncbi:MAG: DNA primase family protein, partial [Blastocatellia bacterium]